MKTKTYLLLLALLAILRVGNAQNTGSIKVTVSDAKNKEAIPFANVILYKGKIQSATATTDIDGNATINKLSPGKYNVKTVYVGYNPKQINDVIVNANKTTYVPMALTNGGAVLLDMVVTEYKTPLIDPDTKSGGTIDREYFQSMPNKNMNAVISTQPGVVYNYSQKGVRGSRSGKKDKFIDGEGVAYNNSKGKEKTAEETYVNEEYSSFKESAYNTAHNQPLSTFAIDVDAASYSNARRLLQQGMLPQKDAVRVEEFINYFPYNYPQPKDDKPFSITTEYAACPWDKNHTLLQIGLKGKEVDFESAPASHLVFLIDVSGSMEDENKLPLLKRAFKLLVKQLRPKDRLSIVVYAGSSGMIIENASGDEKEPINQALEVLTAGGSTAGGDGINLAYKIAEKHFLKNGNNRVILATDGDFNVGVSSEKELENLIVEKRNNGIYLSVLGFGEGNLKDSKMETLADKGNGNYYYIDNFMEARKVLVSQFGGTLYTIAKDVKIQIEFNPAAVKEYRLIGYDNRLLAAEDFNDDKKDAGELGSGHCVTALYEIIPAGSAESHAKVDELKYSKPTSESINSNEMATVKFRYKDVKKQDTTSKLISQVVPNHVESAEAASSNFKLAAGVSEFALLLRESEYKGAASFKQAIDLVNQSKATDPNGYIAGLLEMIKIASDLSDTKVSKK
ncbi:MAG TPA: von Willebrand factor type A domain-containing protein [Bacteroidia bacterium]|nr:von Willebrand factor type A domain-containing protein [Bacteroidia bacterium]